MRSPYAVAIAYLFLSLVHPRSTQAGPGHDDKSETEKRLHTAQELTDIRASGSQPFRLSASIKLFDERGQAQQGTYQLAWEDRTRWKDELKLPDFSQFRLANGDKLFIGRNPRSSLSMEVFRLIRLLAFPILVDPFTDEKVSKRKETDTRDGHEICIEVRFRNKVQRIVYLDAVALVPTRIDSNKNGTVFLFQGYSPFGSHQFPNTLVEQKLSKPFIEIQVQELVAASFGQDSFTPPSDAHSIRWCPDPVPVKMLSDNGTNIPQSLRDSLKRHVVIYGVMGADGKWHNVVVVKSGGREADSFWTNVLLREQFSPAMCGSEAVVQEVVREFYFP